MQLFLKLFRIYVVLDILDVGFYCDTVLSLFGKELKYICGKILL